MRHALLLAASLVALPAVETTSLSGGWSTSTALRASVGLAAPLDEAAVPGGVAWTRWRAGPHVDLRVDVTHLHAGSLGVLGGIGVAVDESRGEMTSLVSTSGRAEASGSVRMRSYQAIAAAGLAWRFDNDPDRMRALPRQWQVEVLATVGAGVAQGRIDSAATDNGSILSGGAEASITGHLGDGWTTGATLSWRRYDARLAIAGSATGTWSARGLGGGLVLGYRF
jgi:hypothetical protein